MVFPMTNERASDRAKSTVTGEKCPECQSPLAHRSGCTECPCCGFAFCTSWKKAF